LFEEDKEGNTFLFVFDNLEDLTSVKANQNKFNNLVNSLLDKLVNSSILISSRNTPNYNEDQGRMYREEVLELEPLEINFAVDLFEKQMTIGENMLPKKLQLVDPGKTSIIMTRPLTKKWHESPLWVMLAGNP
jgi:hypothetical protein